MRKQLNEDMILLKASFREQIKAFLSNGGVKFKAIAR